jgi:hypothetical protein
MGSPPPPSGPILSDTAGRMPGLLAQVEQRARVLASTLPTNRAYLDALRAVGAAERLR